ncbi:hypothetical protein AB0E16_25305, partial [Streptomyces sp. NPDC047970]
PDAGPGAYAPVPDAGYAGGHDADWQGRAPYAPDGTDYGGRGHDPRTPPYQDPGQAAHPGDQPYGHDPYQQGHSGGTYSDQGYGSAPYPPQGGVDDDPYGYGGRYPEPPSQAPGTTRGDQ